MKNRKKAVEKAELEAIRTADLNWEFARNQAIEDCEKATPLDRFMLFTAMDRCNGVHGKKVERDLADYLAKRKLKKEFFSEEEITKDGQDGRI